MTPWFDCYYTNEFGDKEDGIGLMFYLAGTEYLKIEDVLVSSRLSGRIRLFSRSVPEDLMARRFIAFRKMEIADHQLLQSLNVWTEIISSIIARIQ